MDFLPLAVAVFTGLVAPGLFSAFRNKRVDRLERLKTLAELRKASSDLPEGDIIARLIEAELKSEVRSRKKLGKANNIFISIQLGLATGVLALVTLTAYTGFQPWDGIISPSVTQRELDSTLFVILPSIFIAYLTILVSMKVIADRGPSPVEVEQEKAVKKTIDSETES